MPGHEFIYDNPERIEIYTWGVALPAHYLGCHVAWCAGCVLGVFSCPGARNAEIRYLSIPPLVQHYVLRFYISMNESLLVHVFQTR